METPPSIAEIPKLEQVLYIGGIEEPGAGMCDFLRPFLTKTKGSTEVINPSKNFARHPQPVIRGSFYVAGC